MRRFDQYTLKEYLNQLAQREPVPGGGSASALAGALGAGLISMVANYSIGRKANTKAVEERLRQILKTSEAARARLMRLVTLDSQAYLNIVKAKNDPAKQGAAARKAASVGKEICQLCTKVQGLAPILATQGSPYLKSDIDVAIALLKAGFQGSKVMVKINER